MRLSDTLHARLGRAARAARAGRACTSAARPSTQRAHVGNARPFVVGDVAARAGCATRGYDVTLVHNITDVNDKIYEAAPGASAELAARRDRVVPRGHRATSASAGPTTSRRRPRRSRADRRVHRGAGRARLRVRGRAATSTSASRASPSTGSSPASGRTRSRSRSRTRSRRTRATSRSGRRTSRARTRRGTRRGAAAGPGWHIECSVMARGAPRAGVRDPRRRARPRLPAPRERARAVARARPRVRAASGCTTGCSASRGEKMSKSLGNVVTLRDALDDVGARDAARLLPDRPLAQADRLLRRDAGAGGGARPSASATSSARRRSRRPTAPGSASRRRSTTTSTRPRRSRSCTSGATTSCSGGRSTSSGSRRSRDGRRRRRRSSSSPRAPRGARGGARLRRGRPAARTRSRPPAGRCATSGRRLPARPAAVTRELVYGRRAVREALRGRREVLELWATERARRGRAVARRGRQRACT